MLPRYLAVTPEAIRDAATAVFKADNRVVITYLPEGFDADAQALAADVPAGAEDTEGVAA